MQCPIFTSSESYILRNLKEARACFENNLKVVELTRICVCTQRNVPPRIFRTLSRERISSWFSAYACFLAGTRRSRKIYGKSLDSHQPSLYEGPSQSLKVSRKGRTQKMEEEKQNHVAKCKSSKNAKIFSLASEISFIRNFPIQKNIYSFKIVLK